MRGSPSVRCAILSPNHDSLMIQGSWKVAIVIQDAYSFRLAPHFCLDLSVAALFTTSFSKDSSFPPPGRYRLGWKDLRKCIKGRGPSINMSLPLWNKCTDAKKTLQPESRCPIADPTCEVPSHPLFILQSNFIGGSLFEAWLPDVMEEYIETTDYPVKLKTNNPGSPQQCHTHIPPFQFPNSSTQLSNMPCGIPFISSSLENYLLNYS